jgi:dCMP deaminase
MRPTFEEVNMRYAFEIARRSTCVRKSAVDGTSMKVGCVIVSRDFRRVLASGYNGNASGLSNACDDPTTAGACGCIHAEANAVISCVESRATEKTVFSTHQPCPTCSKYLIQLGGVSRVYYARPYRLTAGLDLMRFVGIQVEQFVMPCRACSIEAEIGTKENPHPVPERFHTCNGPTEWGEF